jgi:DHA1 family bicyclomycin/chloramphenicol resistance-like MFS transporter
MLERASPRAPLPPLSSPLSPAAVAFVLALLLGLQVVTTDLYLPALPVLARDLSAPLPAVQQTMAALILTFGLGQLVWGPVADRLGRRFVLRLGLALYALASVAAALAPGIGWLIAARAVQGATLASAVVCARAMVRDLYPPQEGTRVLSLGLSGLGVIAVLTPAAGGFIAQAFGWRGALAAVAAFGLLVLAHVWRVLPETAAALNPRALHLQPLLRTWGQILRHPTFLSWAVLVACTYGGLFTILAGSAFVYIGALGMAADAFGLVLGSGSVAYLAGTFVCRRWLAAHGMTGAVKRAAVFSLLGGASMAALALAGVHAVWAVLLPQWLFCFAHGVHQPCGNAGAVGPFPAAAGAASAMSGFVLAVTAFGVAVWLGFALDSGAQADPAAVHRSFALGLGWWGCVTAALAWTVVQQHGSARLAAA